MAHVTQEGNEMTQPTEAPAIVPKNEAFARLTKAVMRRRTIRQLVHAIERDMETLDKTDVLVRRSERVLKYMRGYIQAVEDEQAMAQESYDAAIVAAAQPVKKGKSSLGRIRRNGNDGA